VAMVEYFCKFSRNHYALEMSKFYDKSIIILESSIKLSKKEMSARVTVTWTLD
jgi:hypothetical protein